MTDKELDEINEKVAKKLGKHIWNTPCLQAASHDSKSCLSDLPDYSRSIEAAWEIVEHLIAPREDRLPSKIMIAFLNLKEWQININSTTVIADTAPLAICKAFLKMNVREG